MVAVTGCATGIGAGAAGGADPGRARTDEGHPDSAAQAAAGDHAAGESGSQSHGSRVRREQDAGPWRIIIRMPFEKDSEPKDYVLLIRDGDSIIALVGKDLEDGIRLRRRNHS
jgi:hypothetical protein